MKQTGWKPSITAKLVLFNATLLLCMAFLLFLMIYWLQSPSGAALACCLLLLLGLACSYWFGAILSGRLRRINALTQRIADGDLKQEKLALRAADEITEMARAVEKMLDNLRSLVGQIVETALSINPASSEIFASAKRQEHNATEQASSVDETTRTMATLLASSKQIAESAQVVLANAEKTLLSNQLVAERIENLNAQSQRITEILEVIKDIANKSDLLALNASLEGTKAGEAGRGFSLVAAEMRRVAEDVMGSVKDIKDLVSVIRQSSHAAVLATEDGTKLSRQTTDSARQISLITQQQQTGTEQITQSMDDLSELLAQSVGASKEATTAAQELMQLSERLRFLVFNFKLGEDRKAEKPA